VPGKSSSSACYWRNYFNDIAVGELDHERAVVTNFAAFAAGRDPVLEAILEKQA